MIDIKKRSLLIQTPVYQIDLDIDNERLIQDIKDHREEFPEGESSNVKAWRSSYKTHKQTDRFDSYIQRILDSVEDVKNFDSQYFSRLNIITYDVLDFWALMYEEGDHTIDHTHWPCTWASCYYAYAEEDSAPIQFKSLRIRPKSGMLLLWPGSLFHSVPKTKGKRIAISANLMVNDFGS